MNRTYVHIGLPKTGTTSLQDLFFAAHPQLAFLGQTNLWQDKDAKTVIKSLLVEDYCHSIGGVKAVSKVVDRLLKNHDRLVISDEAFTFGEFMLRGPQWSLQSNHPAMANRIQKILGNVDIFIVLRNQVDWLISWHRQGLKTGKYHETHFKRWLDREIGPHRDHLYSLLDYDSLYNAYSGIFGRDHVHVYFYENYKDQFELLAGQMAQVMNIDSHHAMRSLAGAAKNVTGEHFLSPSTTLKKLVNTKPLRAVLSVIPGSIKEAARRLLSGEQKYLEMGENEKVEILNYFAESNRKFFNSFKNYRTHQFVNKVVLTFLLVTSTALCQFNGRDFSIGLNAVYTTSAKMFLNPNSSDIFLRNNSFPLEDIVNPAVDFRFRISESIILELNIDYMILMNSCL